MRDRWLGSCRADRFLPLFLHTRRKFFDSTQEGGELPDFFLGDLPLPCRHAGVANAVANDMGNVPFGIVGRIENELRNWRIKASAKLAGLAVETAVAARTVHHVKLHAVDE